MGLSELPLEVAGKDLELKKIEKGIINVEIGLVFQSIITLV
jgi:hypothetical protein